MGGDMLSGLTTPQLRKVLRSVLSGERRDLPATPDGTEEPESAEEPATPADRARARWAR
jgi:hypothetical protein